MAAAPEGRSTIARVPVAKDDWRRMGQERFLMGLKFAWRRYQAFSGNWEHEHCEFCFKCRRRLNTDPSPPVEI